ncbi:hypothetical protein DL98DRAFT_177633 [Cadophora sp. DSE1049]|nr:hypothetical protein DL98DRAFT_177633 [Cadophora sp. DSE1049]
MKKTYTKAPSKAEIVETRFGRYFRTPKDEFCNDLFSTSLEAPRPPPAERQTSVACQSQDSAITSPRVQNPSSSVLPHQHRTQTSIMASRKRSIQEETRTKAFIVTATHREPTFPTHETFL